MTWSYRQYVQEIELVAKAFIKLGLKRSHAVGIIGFNAPEWHISNIAAVVAGGLGTGIYTTNSPEAVRSGMNALLVIRKKNRRFCCLQCLDISDP